MDKKKQKKIEEEKAQVTESVKEGKKEKKEFGIGDRIKVITKDKEFEGILMPASELAGDVTVIKLDNGYNAGIDNRKIKEIVIVGKKRVEVKKENQEKIKEGKKEIKKEQKKELPNLPIISIFHTGGTIASKVDYKTGGVVARFSPEEILGMFPELKKIANIRSRLIRNMASDDMRFAHYNIMCDEIAGEIKEGVDGIIITHGTDTLHYTSAALSFMLDNLPIPVILVGSQRSSDRPSSDAAVNLVCAAKFIANADFSGVAICMHENINDDSCIILPGTKCRKMHTSRRDAFRPINSTAIARIMYKENNIEFFSHNFEKKDRKRKLEVKKIKENLKVGMLKVHTNMYTEEFSAYEGFDGLIIEGTGLGHAPISDIDEFTKEHTKIFDAIKKIVASGTIVAMASQTIYGRVNMNVYSPARRLQQIGVLGNLADMTPETAFIKLAWLLSNYSGEEAKNLIVKNLKGEISEIEEKEGFLI